MAAMLTNSGMADEAYQSAEDFARHAKELREKAIQGLQPLVAPPAGTQRVAVSDQYPWKTEIVTTVFWIGRARGRKKDGSTASAWDANWARNYGGYDNPEPKSRRDFIPANFVPRQNPFYIALPYNDVSRNFTRPEAKTVIPWYRDLVTSGQWVDGHSICHNRWLAIRNHAGKVCYAQWSDCGPYKADHWQYVFGNEKPRPNANGGAGLNVSPAVRDYLQLADTDVTDWKFVEVAKVPDGPWGLYGENNPLVGRKHADEEARPAAPSPEPPPPANPSGGTKIILPQFR
jgi:hypothetical protein